MIIGLPTATDDNNNNNNNVGLKIIAFGYLSIYLSIYLSMQGGGVVGGEGGTGAPTAMSQLWGGPACKRLRTPVLDHHVCSVFQGIKTYNIFQT